MKRFVGICLLFASGITPALSLQPAQPGWDNTVLSFDDAKRAADAGDAYAQAVVSIYYSLGWKTEKNVDLAVTYAIASAKAGHPLGIYRVGVAARSGEGTVKNENQGLKFQANSIEGLNKMGGNPYAITSLGVMLFQGKVMQENKQEAARLYKIAADMGYAPAQFNYAKCAEAGNGMEKNPAIRDAYLQKAVNESYSLALASSGSASGEASMNGNDVWIDPVKTYDSTFNLETKIWEPPKIKGKTSHWQPLITPESSKSISVDFRVNYSFFPGPENAKIPREVIAQYCILQKDNDSYDVQLTRPPQELFKNQISPIIEYPIALEFRVSNNSNTDQHIDALTFDVVSSKLIKDFLPASAGGLNEFYLHNYGWDNDRKIQAIFTMYDLYTDKKVMSFGINAKTSKATVYGWKHFLGIHEKNLYREISHYKINIKDDLNVDYSAFCSVDEYSRAESHVKFPAKCNLPLDRGSYRITFPINRIIPKQSSIQLMATFDSEKSMHTSLRPYLSVSDSKKYLGKTLNINYSTFRPVKQMKESLYSESEEPRAFDYQEILLRSKSTKDLPKSLNNTLRVAQALSWSESGTSLQNIFPMIKSIRPDDSEYKEQLLTEGKGMSGFFEDRDQVSELFPNIASKPSCSFYESINDNRLYSNARSEESSYYRIYFKSVKTQRGFDSVMSLWNTKTMNMALQVPWTFLYTAS